MMRALTSNQNGTSMTFLVSLLLLSALAASVNAQVSFDWDSPDNNSFINKNHIYISWNLTCEENCSKGEGENATYALNWNHSSNNNTKVNQSNTNHTNNSYLNLTGLNDGIYIIQAIAYERCNMTDTNTTNNTNSTYNITNITTITNITRTSIRHVTIDTQPPLIEMVSEGHENNTCISSDSISIDWTMEEPNIDSMIFSWDGINTTMSEMSINKTNVSDGTHTYYVWANDSAGNTKSTALMNITVCKEEAIHFEYPKVGITYTKTGNHTLNWSAQGGNITGLDLYIDGNINATDLPSNGSIELKGLKEGEHIYRLVAYGPDGAYDDTGNLTLIADHTVPMTEAYANTSSGQEYDPGNITYNDVYLHLHPLDNMSGINKTYYCIDRHGKCVPQDLYDSRIHIDDENKTYVRYYSTDLAGNEGNISTFEIEIFHISMDGSPYILPSETYSDDDLECRVPDIANPLGCSMEIDVSWYKDGMEQESLEGYQSIAQGNTSKGDIWMCSAVAVACNASTGKRSSSPSEVLNSRPSSPGWDSPSGETEDRTPYLDWEGSEDADGDAINYWIMLGDDDSSYDILSEHVGDDTYYDMHERLDAPGYYYYKVIATDGQSNSTEDGRFYIVVPEDEQSDQQDDDSQDQDDGVPFSTTSVPSTRDTQDEGAEKPTKDDVEGSGVRDLPGDAFIFKEGLKAKGSGPYDTINSTITRDGSVRVGIDIPYDVNLDALESLDISIDGLPDGISYRLEPLPEDSGNDTNKTLRIIYLSFDASEDAQPGEYNMSINISHPGQAGNDFKTLYQAYMQMNVSDGIEAIEDAGENHATGNILIGRLKQGITIVLLIVLASLIVYRYGNVHVSSLSKRKKTDHRDISEYGKIKKAL